MTGSGGVEVFEGNKQTSCAREDIIVATGSVPCGIPGIEIDCKRIISSDEVIHINEIQESIAILRSGPVGVEFAQIFRRFGSKVAIVELLPELVSVENGAVPAELEKLFRKRGITSHTAAKVTKAAVKGDGVEMDVQFGDSATEAIQTDCLLVATG